MARKEIERLCDGCGKIRRDVQSCGRDTDGTPDAPDLCFICRKEAERSKYYSHKLKRYVHHLSLQEDRER